MKGILSDGTRVYRRIEVGAIVAFLLASLALYVYLERQPYALPAHASGMVEALATAMPNQGWVPMEVQFGAFGSASRGSSIVRYEWDLDGNGRYDTDATASGGYASYRYLSPGHYTVTLRVTDQAGRTATDQVTIVARHPASSSVDYWSVFDDSRVGRVEVLLSQADWDLVWSDPEAKATVPADVVISGERVSNVGWRMRAQYSLTASHAKKPWEIDTDAFVEGQEYRNLKQLLFSNNINDCTMLAEKLSYDLMALAGVPASHAAYVELWIDIVDDGQPAIFWGVYNMIERVDRKFLANRFGQEAKEGNLYKAGFARGGPMSLIYHGERIEDYPTQNGESVFRQVSGQETTDYADVINLCRVVDGTTYDSPEDFAEALEQVLNVDGFLRCLAVTVATMNWDTYAEMGNNYYLFHNPTTGRFEWFPWDLLWGDEPDYPLYDWQGRGRTERAPLTERIFQVERYRRRYRAYLDLLTRHYVNREWITERARAYYDLIAPYVRQYPGDKMYTSPDPFFSWSQFDDGWLHLVGLAEARSQFIRQELEQVE